MTLALKIIFWWTIADFAVGIPFWIWLTRRDRKRDRQSDRWIQQARATQ
jgi:hypothetical protein